MAGQRRKRVLFAVCGVFAIAVGIGIWASLQSPWHSSPTNVRQEPVSRDLKDPTPERRLITKYRALEKIEVRRGDGGWEISAGTGGLADFGFDWPEYSLISFEGLQQAVGEPLEARDGIADFGDGRILQLLAFSVVRPGDSVEFCDPRSAKKLDPSNLLERGIPEDWLDQNPVWNEISPRLRVIFRQEGHLGFHCSPAFAFDQRTEAFVGSSWRRQGQFLHRGEDCEFIAIDFVLKIWHNTPLELAFGIPAGEPSVFPVDLSQIPTPVISNRGAAHRFRLFAAGSGALINSEIGSPLSEMFSTKLISEDHETGFYVITGLEALGSDSQKERCLLRIRNPTGELFDLWGKGEVSGSDVVGWNVPEGCWDPEALELDFLVYPKMRCVWWSLPGLPPLPEVENLFEVPLTEIHIRDEDGFRDLGGNPAQQLLAVILNATEMTSEQESPFITSSSGVIPEAPPGDLRFENTTPRELLEYFLEIDPSLQLEAISHPERNELEIVKRRPWTERVKSWWNSNAPDWLR